MRRWVAGGVVLLFLAMFGLATFFKNASGANRVEQSEQPLLAGQSRRSLVRSPRKTDFDYESSALIVNVFYKKLFKFDDAMAPDGANGVNARWESNQAPNWYIEEQRYGEALVIGGLLKNDTQAIQAGFKMFDWGFAHQAANGSFPGTGDAFHSTSFFVEAVAHTLLFLQQSPQSGQYADQIAKYTPRVHRAAQWMISPDVWKKGTERNQPYTHRRYLVGAALGLTGKLTGDQELMNFARSSIEDGLSLQQPDGVNPERGSYDTSYHMVGVVYAQRWVAYFPHDSLTPEVAAMIDKALAWEQTKILPTGEIDSSGNTRSAGQETTRAGKVKKVDYKIAIRGFAYWASVTGDSQWDTDAQQITHYYNKLSLTLVH